MRAIVTLSTLTRLGAASALAAGAICSTAVVAAPAHAAAQACQLEGGITYVTNDGPPSVVAEAIEYCGGDHFSGLPITLSKNGVEVAYSITGYTYYNCTGTTTSTYTDQWGAKLTAPCS